MTALSDEDRRAIVRLQAQMDEMAPLARQDLLRILELAGMEPPEPAVGTFWFDPVGSDLYFRNDDVFPVAEGDLYRWWCTGSGEKFSWIEVYHRAPKLVELVRADTSAGKARTILYELASSWQARHHNACGRRETLANCQYHECAHRHQVLLGYGLEKDWEE